jgi:hypothetical protein
MSRRDREDFWFRFRRSFYDLFYGERTSVRVLSRLVLLTFAAGLIATVAPSVAEVLTQDDPGPVSTYVEPTPEPSTEATPEPSAEPSAEATPDPSASESPAPEASTSDASPEATPEPTPEYSVAPVKSDTPTVMPTIEADRALVPQPKYLLKVPQTIAIDPRANSYFLPALYIAGGRFTLVCINGNGVNFDLSNKRISNDRYDTRTVMVSGDGTSNLLISGQTQDVLAVINDGGGLFAFTNSGGLRDRSAFISVVATNKNTIDSNFCRAAASANTASLTFRALGLQVDTRKGSGRLK